jgi:hypothetical protein
MDAAHALDRHTSDRLKLLASLDDAAVALRAAADRCARTSRLLAATMEPPASVQDLRHRIATSTAA